MDIGVWIFIGALAIMLVMFIDHLLDSWLSVSVCWRIDNWPTCWPKWTCSTFHGS